MRVAAAALPAFRDNLAAAADQICVLRPRNLCAVGVKLACSGSWAFSGKFPVFVPLQATNSNGIPGCGRLNWALSEELFIFVPFSPVFHPCLSQEKGTKFEKWPGNANSAMPRSRKPAPKSRNRGTKIEKSFKYAQSQLSRLPATSFRPRQIKYLDVTDYYPKFLSYSSKKAIYEIIRS